MQTIPAHVSLGPAVSFISKVLVLLACLVVVAAFFGFKLGYLSIQNSQLYISTEKIIRVGTEIITPSEINYQAKLLTGFKSVTEKNAPDLQSINDQAREALVRQKIIAQEIRRRGIVVSANEIDQEIQSRASKFGGADVLSKTIASYGWTMDDLRNQTYNQLQEKKLRAQLEGKAYIQQVILWNSRIKATESLKIAQELKDLFSNGVDFTTIKNAAETKSKPSGIAVQYLEQSFTQSSYDSIRNNQKLAQFLKTLKKQEPEIFVGDGFHVVAFAKEKNNGLDFEWWLKTERNKIVTLVPSIEIVKTVYATVDPNPGDNCNHGYANANTFCADTMNDCGNANYDFCTSAASSGCPSSYPYCCVLTAAIDGTITDAATGNPISGAAVSGVNNSVCSQNNLYSHSATSDSSGYYIIAWYNCAGGAVNLSVSATGFPSASQSVDAPNGQTTTVNFNLGTPPPSAKYKCNGASCVRDDTNGTFSTSNCNNTCGGGPILFCGDGACNNGETCSTCSTDCGSCCVPNTCAGTNNCGLTMCGQTTSCADGCGGNITCSTLACSPPTCNVSGPTPVLTIDTPTYSATSQVSGGPSITQTTVNKTPTGANSPSSIATCAGANCSGNTQFATPGTYYVFCTATHDGGNNNSCVGNPFSPNSCGPTGYLAIKANPPSYFQTFGGNITSKGQITDVYLTSTKYIITKGQ